MTTIRLRLRLVLLTFMCLASPLQAQVDYHDNDSPWGQRAESGPDAEVPGWFYNLGITGLRAQLVADQPKALLIKYVFPLSPADGHIKIGDLVVGVGGQLFKEKHRNGYGEKVFGADGPISELAQVLEQCQGSDGKGKLSLTLKRGVEMQEVVLDIGQKYGTYAATYPGTCAKTDKVLAELLDYLVTHQAKDGSFGDPVHNTFAPLALLASGDAKYLPAVERNVRWHCRETRPNDKRYADLMNWTYMSAALVLCEYHMATGEKWVLPELQEVHDHLAKAQYLHMSQINPKAKKSHPDSFPKGPKDSHGGWGHNPGFEGYGPIAMLTGQGALAYSLMHRCGIKVDREKHDAAYAFLKKGTGPNGYVWYGDQIGGPPNGWADMGRTGASGIANFLSPYSEPVYRERAMEHAKVIGLHPQSFPDTHGSPAMGMAYTALAANIDPDSFRKLMDANRWWFTMAHCTDGSFYYQPNRDNAGYGSDSRMTASSVVAFIFTIPKHSLVITGKDAKASKPDDKAAVHSKPIKVYVMLGQSNMLGFGRVGPKETKGSLEFLVKEKGKYPHLIDDAGNWTTRHDVRYVHVMDQRGVDFKDMENFSDVRNEWLTPNKSFGPELGFGHVMGNFHHEPVLLLKACIGNRSLGWDLLPPASERFEFEGKIYAGYKDVANFWDKGSDPKPVSWYAGRQYDADTTHAKAVLKNLDKYYPGYKDQGYEIAGFVWWQGHKDQSAALAGRYEKNLVRLIKSLRKDFDSPNAKFVLATGCGNPGRENFGLQIAEAQLAVDGDNGKYPEFKGNVKAVDTRDLWREADVSPVNQGHHYNHNAETYYGVGDALGRAMAAMLEETTEPVNVPARPRKP